MVSEGRLFNRAGGIEDLLEIWHVSTRYIETHGSDSEEKFMKLIKNIVVSIASLALLLSATARAAEQLVPYGTPPTKLESTSGETSKFWLSDNQKLESHLWIVKREGESFRAGRQCRPLVHMISGAFHLFIEPNGGGYIKVVDRRSLLQNENPRNLYLGKPEHVSRASGLGTRMNLLAASPLALPLQRCMYRRAFHLWAVDQ